MSSNVVLKRLTGADVREIFSSVANNRRPPERLEFKIVRVPFNGMKLSPPSFEFDDGLYVLLRSPRNGIADVPPQHEAALLTDGDLASLPSCPWSLSGPQNPKHENGGLQQRYCYPKGNTVYSVVKGGVLWTMLDSKGLENIDCRVLHVYRSSKRAGAPPKAEGQSIVRPTSQAAKSQGMAVRRFKRKNCGGGQDSNKRNKTAAAGTKMEPVVHMGPMVVQCPSICGHSLLQAELLKSPCQSQMSFELDSNLDLNCENSFDSKGAMSINPSFSFIPVPSKDIEEMVSNNPAFNSAAIKPQFTASNGYYYNGHYARHPPYTYGGRHGYHGDWARAAPPIPHLTSSENRAAGLSLQDFSKWLDVMKASITSDIGGSDRTDQVHKLHLLQNWAKEMACKPLQTTSSIQEMACNPLQTTSSTQEMVRKPLQATPGTQSMIKVEDPGTPSISP